MNERTYAAYLFDARAQEELAAFVDGQTLFAFDLDGTLAPIVPDPATIGIPADIQKALIALAACAPVAVITGRSRHDALSHLPVTPRYLIGNHGAEGLPGWDSRENRFVRAAQIWQNHLGDYFGPDYPEGVEIENKGATLSIHYRRAVNIPAAHDIILQAIDRLTPKPVRISGKFIENLIPKGAPDKGAALGILMEKEKFKKALFTGDDDTDERVFSLDRSKIFSIRVGEDSGSRAAFYLHGQHEVAKLLRILKAILEKS